MPKRTKQKSKTESATNEEDVKEKSKSMTCEETLTKKAPQKNFETLEPSLSDGVLAYVKSKQFQSMTPVQAATIPLFLNNKDVAVQAVTGSGKTLAFMIPCVEQLLKKKPKKQNIGALILSPTRELAQQTHQVASELCQFCKLPEPLLLVGGAASGSSNGATTRPVSADLQAFQKLGSDIVVGTPGRVEDVLTRYAVLDCAELEYLILDEADVLLNMGFATTLQNILSKLPKMRRTGLFSATTSSATNSSLKEWMHRAGLRNPVWIDVAVASKGSKDKASLDPTNKQATPSSLTNYYLITPLEEKLSRLAAFLQQHRDEKVIVFFLTCACVEFYGHSLQQLVPDVSIEILHGKMVQKRREKTMERFRESGSGEGTKKGSALFCTDVAARGLDVGGDAPVHWVVQFDAPQDPAFYVHRVGRAARAGRQGSSLLFLTSKEESYIDLLSLKKVPLSLVPTSEWCAPAAAVDDEILDKDNQTSGTNVTTITSAAHPDNVLENLLPRVRDLVLHDRDMLEKGTKAFTSYIRAYKEHHCAFIFRFASLDLGRVATSFCLLRLPKMPELKPILDKNKGRLPHFTPAGHEVDIFSIPYKDKVREKARQQRLAQELSMGGKNAKLLKAEKRKAEKERKQDERRQAAIDKGRNPDKKRGKNAQLMDEWDELAKEERLYKKLKKGKISEKEYNDEMDDI